MSTSITQTERIRRSLTQGRGMDGVFVTLLGIAGVVFIVLVLVFGLRRAESKANEAADETHLEAPETSSDIGTL